MKNDSFNFSEFINPEEDEVTVDSVTEVNEENEVLIESEDDNDFDAEDIDVQKAVVEELAAEKIELNEKLSVQESELNSLKIEFERKAVELEKKSAEVFSLKAELEKAMSQVNALSAQLAAHMSKEQDLQERNPNALALLDREVELPDRFPGETRDHVIEVLREARDRAEADGRVRLAQILESVLVANEPNGTLARKRAELEKLFADNGNILAGPVIDELVRLGISHKNGEDYLLPNEILSRTY